MTVFLLALWACTGAPPEVPEVQRDPGGGGGEAPDGFLPEDIPSVVDTGEPPESVGGTEWEPDEVVDEIGDQERDDAWLFNHDEIHHIEITLPASSIDALTAAPYDYAEGDVVVDGASLEGVGVRLRGKLGSFRTITGKPKFKIDLNQYSDQDLRGIETLSLNNEVVDCSYLKEPIAYAAFEAAGVPAPRTAFATVALNGNDYGLYVIIETPDDEFLDRAFEDGSGNLYDGKYDYDYTTGSYTLLDFNEGVDHLFQLEEGTEVGNEDIEAISDTLSRAIGEPDFYERMAEVIHWDDFHRMQLVEQWAGQNDGYGLNSNNYRVYFDPTDGLARFVPWDMDYSFLEDVTWGRSWTYPTGQIAYYCMTDTTCRAQQAALAEGITDAIDDARLTSLHDDLAELIYDAAYADPKRECSWQAVVNGQALVRTWSINRFGYMSDFWGY